MALLESPRAALVDERSGHGGRIVAVDQRILGHLAQSST
jgi:hypothetical protein